MRVSMELGILRFAEVNLTMPSQHACCSSLSHLILLIPPTPLKRLLKFFLNQ